MLESKFQSDLIKKIKDKFPGSIVLKNDPNYIQGMPDLTVLYKNKWATLECKKTSNAKHRPNQDYYVRTMNDMSYSSFIYPDNEDQVLRELTYIFKKEDNKNDIQ